MPPLFLNSAQILPPVAAAGTQYTGKVHLTGMAFVSIQLFWTGTVAGTWSIWVSNKANPNEANDTDWTQLSLAASISQPAGAPGNDFVDLNELGAMWARGKHVRSGGAGNIESWAAGKGG